MLRGIRTLYLNNAGQVARYAALLAIITLLAARAQAGPDDSALERPPAPVIRHQVADILSQPEYQYEYPKWLQRLRDGAIGLLVRLLEWLRLGEAARGLYATWPVLYWIIAGLLAAAVLALLYHIFITIKAAFGRPRRRRPAQSPLPLPLTSPAALRRQAQQLVKAGDLAGALRQLYQACLRYLDQHGYLYYHPATTNGEYLRQVDEHPGLTACLQPIAQAMDRLCYAHIGVGRSTYQHLETLAQRLWQEAETQQ